jgi:hypothetical protein
MLVRVPSTDNETVINALIKQAHELPREPYRSLTCDRGKEVLAISASAYPPTSRSVPATRVAHGNKLHDTG